MALLGAPKELSEVVRLLDVERVLIAFSEDSPEQTLEVLRSLNNLNVRVDVVPRLYELVSPSVKIDTLEGVPLSSFRRRGSPAPRG